MAALSAGKIAEVIFEKALETHEHQMQMLPLTEYFEPDAGDMQNAGNFIWRPVQQHAPIISGFDMTGSETGVIEETYPAVLGTPKNDIFEQRVDDLRDMGFWERRGEESGKKQATELNKSIAQTIVDTGSLFYRTNATSGYAAIAEAQALLNERQTAEDQRYVVLNDRDTLTYASDLAARQTLQGRPESTWATGQIGQNVAEFDVYTGSFLPNITGGADPATTLTADIEGAPTGGSVNASTGVVTNVDYREGTATVTSSASYSVGDYFSIETGGTPVNAIGLSDKTNTNQPMTFVITAIPDGTTIEFFPKTIAQGDGALSTLELAYANVDRQPVSTDTINRLNTDASKKANIFWCKKSIEVLGGDAPLELLSQFGGMKVISSTMSNGQKMYMAYDGNLKTLQFTCRLFTWYGITNANPSANGSFVTF